MCLAELHEGLRAWKQQIPWGWGEEQGRKLVKEPWAPPDPCHLTQWCGQATAVLFQWCGQGHQIKNTKTQWNSNFRYQLVAWDTPILKRYSSFIWNSNFTRQSQFCFSLSKSKSFRFLFSLTKARNLFEKSKEKYTELWDEFSMKTGGEARSRKQVVSGKSHWMIPLSALCNSAPRTLPVRTICSTPSHHWKKAKKQSKKVMGNSLGTLRVTEKIPTEFGGSLMNQLTLYWTILKRRPPFNQDLTLLLKILKDDSVKVLHSIHQQIWKTQQGPQEWKRSVVIPLPKKGNAKECSNYHTIALILHDSKVMLKILQVRLQQYVNRELADFQAGFRKGRGIRDQIANICWIIEKAREFHKNIYFCFIDYAKPSDCVDHNKLCKILKGTEIPDHLSCLLRNL